MIPLTADAHFVVHARSRRRAQDSWGKLVDLHGERSAFAEVAAQAGGSDRAHRALRRHGIAIDLV